jgi:hypothetical protein
MGVFITFERETENMRVLSATQCRFFFNKKAKRHFELTILLKPFKQQDTDQKTIASDPVWTSDLRITNSDTSATLYH